MSSPSLQVLISYNDSNYFSDYPTPVHHSLEMQSVAVPLVLHFNNLTYSVNVPTRKIPFPTRKQRPALATTKVLLNDVSGVAREGEIFAVLGPSGSGKSTLLDALANRITKGSLKGTVTLNGEQLESKLTKIISAYVMQDDLLFPMLTVEETLTFAAEFRLPRTLSKSEKKQRVEALIHQLGLQNARNTVIGDEGNRGVSGGERRRVSIGIDIIHDPMLLFLDEPTSGLDSSSAFMVVKVLQRIARSGSIVIMSVHQPSYRILGLIDRLLFLSRGEAVYNGSPTEIPQYFSDFGHTIPEIENRLEFVLDFIRDLENSPGGTKELVEFNKACLKMKTETPSKSGLSLKEAIKASISRGKLVSGTPIDTSMPKFANPFWVEIGVLSRRSLINSRRMPELFGMRLGVILVSGFFLSTIFWHLDDSPRGVRERLGFFAFVLSTMFYSCADQLPVFIHDRHIFMRETAYNAYRCSSYVIYHTLVDVPPLVFLSLMLALVTFWTVNLDGGLSGLLFYAIAILASYWAGTSFVIFISSLVSQAILGYTIIMSILSYFLLLSGFFIYRDRIPPYWIWFHYMSLIKYPFQATMQNEFEDPVKCFTRGVQIFDNTVLGSETTAMKEKLLQSLSRTLGRTIGSTTCVTTGADILQQVGINDLSKWNSLWITVAWGFLFRFLFYLSLLLGNKNKRI